MNSSIIIKEVLYNKDLKQFVAFQYSLYKDNKYWIPPLISEEIHTLKEEKNPAFDFCETKYWLAYKNNEIVGRIACIINHKFNEKWNSKSARFGWIDFIDDEEVSSLLLKTAEDYAQSKGMTCIHGPLGFTDMDGSGTLIDGFEEVSTLGSIYNFPYYSQHFEQMNYEKDIDYVEYEVTMNSEINEQVKRIAEIALKRNELRLLKVKRSKEYLPYAKEIFSVLNEAYKDLYGFVELSGQQINMYVKQYFGYILPEYVPVILNKENKVVAFGITMPSLSEALQKNKGSLFPFGFIRIIRAMKNNSKADLYLTAVAPEYQNRGVNAILIHEVNKVFVKNGVKKVETNRELEVNSKVQAQWRFFEHRLHKRRRCYKKSLI